MCTLSLQCNEIEGQGGHQRLSLTGFHFRNFALVQHNTTHDLYIKMSHIHGSTGCFTNECKGLRQNIVQCFALRKPLPELICLFSHLFI